MQQFFTQFIFAITTGKPCTLDGGGFLGFPHWYKYLSGIGAPNGAIGNSAGGGTVCVPQVTGLNDIWLILAAIIEILLRLAALAAIAMLVWGGIQFITSQGDPGNTKKARQTAINAVIGLLIAVAATAVVSFVAGSFK